MKALVYFLCLWALQTASSFAATYNYQAVSDFPSLESGSVPYYRDTLGGLNVLAINAANEAYRDKFARAELDFSGEAGRYDVTIAALGEVDGECEYRFLINGEVQGVAVNERVSTDYGVQNHVFRDLEIPAGASLAVESKAVSNDLIPEHDAYAFARGRWRSLQLVSAGETTDSVDLVLNVTPGEASVGLGDEVEFVYSVSNQGTDTATSPALQIQLPQGVTYSASSDCSSQQQQVSCALTELAAGEEASVAFSAIASQSGQLSVSAAVAADQDDSQSSNNTVQTTLQVTDSTLPQYDAGVQLRSLGNSFSSGQTLAQTLTISNHGTEAIETLQLSFDFSAGLSFSPIPSSCEPMDEVVQCRLGAIASGNRNSWTIS